MIMDAANSLVNAPKVSRTARCGKDGFPLFPDQLSPEEHSKVQAMKESLSQLNKTINNTLPSAQAKLRTDAAKAASADKHKEAIEQKTELLQKAGALYFEITDRKLVGGVINGSSSSGMMGMMDIETIQKMCTASAQMALECQKEKSLALENGPMTDIVEQLASHDAEEACKAFFQNSSEETRRAAISKLIEADVKVFADALVENDIDTALEKLLENHADKLVKAAEEENTDALADAVVREDPAGTLQKFMQNDHNMMILAKAVLNHDPAGVLNRFLQNDHAESVLADAVVDHNPAFVVSTFMDNDADKEILANAVVEHDPCLRLAHKNGRKFSIKVYEEDEEDEEDEESESDEEPLPPKKPRIS